MRVVVLLVALTTVFFQAHAQIKGLRECPTNGCTPNAGSSPHSPVPAGRSSSSSTAEKARVIEAVGTYLGQNARESSQREALRDSAGANACPATIVAGGDTFDLAGAFAKYGGPRGLLTFIDGELRAALANPECMGSGSSAICRATVAVARDVKAAVLKCSGGMDKMDSAKAGSEPRTEAECENRYPDALYQQQLACKQRVVQENARKAQADFESLKAQTATAGAAGSPQTTENPWAPKPFKPLDPSRDYSGQSCSYFTKPAREGDHRLNYYADNSFVCYGAKMYKCVARRWESKGPCAAYQDSKSISAEKLEASNFNTKVNEE